MVYKGSSFYTSSPMLVVSLAVFVCLFFGLHFFLNNSHTNRYELKSQGNKMNKIEILPKIFSTHYGMKLEINRAQNVLNKSNVYTHSRGNRDDVVRNIEKQMCLCPSLCTKSIWSSVLLIETIDREINHCFLKIYISYHSFIKNVLYGFCMLGIIIRESQRCYLIFLAIP